MFCLGIAMEIRSLSNLEDLQNVYIYLFVTLHMDLNLRVVYKGETHLLIRSNPLIKILFLIITISCYQLVCRAYKFHLAVELFFDLFKK